MSRFIALLIIVIPGIIATIGIKLMRDAIFHIVYPVFFHFVIQFVIGLAFFILGLTFIGGFILHRDRKRNLTKGRFSKQKKS
ncbi:Mn2+/Fe2+ NRAMP family transporter [Salirhabdus euzebyi]|uniref:Mn2+/Fe2+ NRAMP family transporter n=1 Tax=Salirhabdus euzebyi TaxID=394506 RepID=A0A841Q729_9BACI|nr:DUF2627 domain-containing protein [Salirhabdus euzebyi]MBB6454208.1 Mn2+/Fe2+ NRAMP family transporter [Salirhabdus euzebyi]